MRAAAARTHPRNDAWEDDMPDLDANGITDEVVAQMASTPDPRLREVMQALVRHLHASARGVNLTPDEWLKGIAFLTATGQKCTPIRQEFILLSDVLGLSRLVNVMHDAAGREAAGTETSLLGPFFREAAPEVPLGGTIAHVSNGPEVVMFGQVTDAEGRPIAGAEMDVWQTNHEGLYDLQAGDPETMELRGRLPCDGEGRYHVRTLKPLGYSIPMDGPVGALVGRQARHGFRPAHIHILVQAPGHRELVTALYLGEDPHIGSDTVFGVSDSLVITPRDDVAGNPSPGTPAIRYDFRLSRVADGEGGARVGSDPSRLVPAQWAFRERNQDDDETTRAAGRGGGHARGARAGAGKLPQPTRAGDHPLPGRQRDRPARPRAGAGHAAAARPDRDGAQPRGRGRRRGLRRRALGAGRPHAALRAGPRRLRPPGGAAPGRAAARQLPAHLPSVQQHHGLRRAARQPDPRPARAAGAGARTPRDAARLRHARRHLHPAPRRAAGAAGRGRRDGARALPRRRAGDDGGAGGAHRRGRHRARLGGGAGRGGAGRGDVRILTIFDDRRHRDFPEGPTAVEQGFDVRPASFGGLFAPAGTPDAVLARVEQASEAAVRTDTCRTALRTGSQPDEVFFGREAFGRRLNQGIEQKAVLLRGMTFN